VGDDRQRLHETHSNGVSKVIVIARCLSLADYVRGPEGHLGGLGGDRRVPTC
jgi:hypothetical protein